MLKVVVLISGGGSNLKALLEAAADAEYPARVVAVGSDTDAAGLEYAREAGIPAFIVRPRDYENREEWGRALAAAINEHLSTPPVERAEPVETLPVETPPVERAELVEPVESNGTADHPGELRDQYLVVSAGLMRVLPAGFVREFSPNLINTHPALLPLFPGAHAVRDALAAGASETGVTVHIIDEGVDTGPALRQRSVEILSDESEDDLHERIKQIERPLLVETVREIATGELDLGAASRVAP